MNENLIVVNLTAVDPTEAVSVSDAGAAYTVMPITATLVHVVVSPFEDDGSATMDIQDDGSDIVTGIDASDHDAPGEWATTHTGGTNDPVQVAAGSEISLDFNSVSAANRFDVSLYFLTGAVWG